MGQPDLKDLCGELSCRHEFGMHYVTYSGLKSGCAFSLIDQRESYYCSCDGFKVVYRHPQEMPQ